VQEGWFGSGLCKRPVEELVAIILAKVSGPKDDGQFQLIKRISLPLLSHVA